MALANVIAPPPSIDYVSGNTAASLDTFTKLADFPSGYTVNNTVVLNYSVDIGDGWMRGMDDGRVKILVRDSGGYSGIYTLISSASTGGSSFLNKPITVAIGHA